MIFEEHWDEIEDEKELLCGKTITLKKRVLFVKGHKYKYVIDDDGYMITDSLGNDAWFSPIKKDYIFTNFYVREYFFVKKDDEYKKLAKGRKRKNEQFYNDH